ncbi:MAG: SMC-Scp complex subunit ScpB [Spongiibacteraceae bacterium]|nr:SMC-Scp complex subunit ScpB [Spongiibacteraceae bacterium]
MSTEENESIEERVKPDNVLLQRILEGVLLAAAKPLSVRQLAELFEDSERPANDEIQSALEDIQSATCNRGFELKEVASGYRSQVVQEVSQWVSHLWDVKPQKYSRALLETLSLIAYRQPITRGDIEDIRGVAVSSHIIKTLIEREWIRIVGHKDVPGRPAMFATTRQFLDYFNLKNLDDLPSLAEIRDLDSMNNELALEGVDTLQISEEAETELDAEIEATTEEFDTDTEAQERECESVQGVESAEAIDVVDELELDEDDETDVFDFETESTKQVSEESSVDDKQDQVSEQSDVSV